MGFMVKKLLNLHFYFIILFLDSVDLTSNNNQPISLSKIFVFILQILHTMLRLKKKNNLSIARYYYG
jgi:hypothetical protein